MFKFLLPLSVLASPISAAQAQTALDIPRMGELYRAAQVACPIAVKSSDTIATLFRLVPVYSNEEKYYVTTLCAMLVKGRLDELRS